MITLWHNPRCSKSRAALALLSEAGVEVEVRLYLTDPPSRAELDAVLSALGLPAAAILRKGETRAKALGLSPQSDEAVLRAAMVSDPILIDRPIALRGERAVLGRPPEEVLGLL